MIIFIEVSRIDPVCNHTGQAYTIRPTKTTPFQFRHFLALHTACSLRYRDLRLKLVFTSHYLQHYLSVMATRNVLGGY